MRSAIGTFCLGIAAVVFAGTAACTKSAPKTQPSSGRLTIGVTSTGPGVAALTFTVLIEPAGVSRPIKADAGVFTSNDTPAGDHVVRLNDLPARCRVDGDQARRITVSARDSAVVRFVVVCS